MKNHLKNLGFVLSILLLALALAACGGGGGGAAGDPGTGDGPAAPTGVSAIAGNSQVTISWNAVDTADSYNLYWSTSSGVSKSNGTRISDVTSPYIHTSRTNGTPYYYIVTAVNGSGESVKSSQASATPAAAGHPYLTQWGSYGTGNGQFKSLQGLAVDSSANVYVADSGRIQKFSATGTYITQWPSSNHLGVAVDSNDNVYVADWITNQIRKYSSSGALITQWGSFGVHYDGSGAGEFQDADAIAIDSSNNVYVTDWGNGRVQKFTSGGAYLMQLGLYGTGNGEFNGPAGITVDANGNIFVADSGNDRIQKFSSTGTYITQWGSYGSGNGEFNFPTPIGVIGMAVDASGNVYVADANNSRIQVFSNSGTYITQIGDGGFADGRFYYGPYGLALDSSGNLYAADSLNYRVQKFGP